MCRPKLRMRYRMSVIYGHPVMAATRALRFSDHVTKRNGGSGDENGQHCCTRACALGLRVARQWPGAQKHLHVALKMLRAFSQPVQHMS